MFGPVIPAAPDWDTLLRVQHTTTLIVAGTYAAPWDGHTYRQTYDVHISDWRWYPQDAALLKRLTSKE